MNREELREDVIRAAWANVQACERLRLHDNSPAEPDETLEQHTRRQLRRLEIIADAQRTHRDLAAALQALDLASAHAACLAAEVKEES
jgi:hypothetical protein